MSASTTELHYPSTLEEVNPAWLTSALSIRYPSVRVASAKITKLIDGTATKVRYQVEYDTNSAETGAPPSLWVKGGFNPKGADQGAAFANEVNFFRDLAPVLDINVPDCYYGAIDRKTNNGVVLLEDLINRNATFGIASQPLTVDSARQVLELQATYHAAFWHDEKLKKFTWLKSGGAMAEADMVKQFFSLWGPAEKLNRFKYVTGSLRDKSRSENALEILVNDLRRNGFCLVHGDTHAANLFFEPGGKPGYLDWQHVMRGSWAFDVANFLITSLTVEDRRKHEQDLLRQYLANLRSHGASAPRFDEAWLEYRRYAMWPFMWTMCPVDVHPEEVCSFNSERACTAIQDLDTVSLLEAM